MSIIALIGPPGSGKTTMACLTSVNKPVHVIDIDRKIRSMVSLQGAIKKGELTVWELSESLMEDSLGSRMRALVENKAPSKPPRGWTMFANYSEKMESIEEVVKAGTIVLDSTTQLSYHMREHMQFLSNKTRYNWDLWSAWGSMWKELTTAYIDYCLSTNKDLIMIFHERVGEAPSEDTKKVIVKQSEGGRQREYVGTMDVKVSAAIDGAYGKEFGTYFTEIYALEVKIENDKPRWVCRVLPDRKRDLRTSFDVKGQAEWEPNFGKIWGVSK